MTAVSINSNEIRTALDELYVKTEDTQAKIEEKRLQQQQREEALIKQAEVCHYDQLARPNLMTLNDQAVKEIVTHQFFSAEILQALMCLTSSTYITEPSSSEGALTYNEKIRHYIDNLHRIGAESAFGYAMLGDFDQVKNLFVVKVSQNPAEDNLLHELIVGLYGTNLLRKYSPNFAYVFGGFKCAPAIINPATKEIATWCTNNENSVNYLLYENVAPAISFQEYVADCTASEFLNAYLQVLYALNLAQELIDFTHYDLHPGNVLLRQPTFQFEGEWVRPGKTFQIPYFTQIEGLGDWSTTKVEFFRTTVVPTIIDYGNAHIQIEGQHYGFYDLVAMDVNPGRSWIMYDAYKLLMYLGADAAKAKNWPVLDEIAEIFKYFNQTESFDHALDDQHDTFYILPFTELTQQMNLPDLIDHIKKYCPCDFIFSQPTEDPPLNCDETCLSAQAFYRKIGADQPRSKPTTILDFSQLLSRTKLKSDERRELRQQFRSDYPDALADHLAYMEMLVEDILDLVDNLNLPELKDVPSVQFDQLQSELQQEYANLAEALDMIVTLRTYQKAALIAADEYDNRSDSQQIFDLMRSLAVQIRPVIKELLTTIENNDQVIEQTSQAKLFDWYKQMRAALSSVISEYMKFEQYTYDLDW